MVRYRQELEQLTVAGPTSSERMEDRDWFVDAFTLRIAATRAGLWFSTDDATAFHGHRDDRPDGALCEVGTMPPLSVTLVVLAQGDGDALQAMLADVASQFAETIIVLDTPVKVVLDGPNVRTVCRPLDGNFAAQRNAGNHAATADWVFHLDLDERIAADLPVTLGHLAAHAERAGLAAIGLPRGNLVDGVLSDHFPDVQYRFMPRTERFENRVHERPFACRDWTRTSIFLQHPISHHLSRARVAERSRHYDDLGQSPDRHDDMRHLLEPYRA